MRWFQAVKIMKSYPGGGIKYFVLTSAIIISGCASTTILATSPDNAYVYIRGQNRGKTPYKYSDIKVAFSSTPVTFRKTGYHDKKITLKKNEEIDVGALFGGLICYFPNSIEILISCLSNLHLNLMLK